MANCYTQIHLNYCNFIFQIYMLVDYKEEIDF